MKRVVSSNMVAHLWANQAQDGARNSNRSMYFEGATIYSYGSHFPMARHVTIPKKDLVLVLFTTRTYSKTTSKHLSLTRRAVSHLEQTVIACHNVMAGSAAEHVENLKIMRESVACLLLKAARAKSQYRIDGYVAQAEYEVRNHARYRAAFGLLLDKPLFIPENWKAESLERVKRLAAAQAKKDKQLILDTLEVLKYWKQGQAALNAAYQGKEKPAYNLSKVPVALRLAANGEEIETSLGARVPVNHARRIWILTQQIVSKQLAPYQHNGHSEHVGNFRVDSIDEAGTLKAGCHTIPYEAMQELANTLNW